jgi:Rrf2 family protein
MQVTLSKTGDYAVRAAIVLAEKWHEGGSVTIAQVSNRMNLPPAFTPQVLGLLARAGLARSKPGRGGGYRLARAPEDISLLEVVEAAEGPLTNGRCTMRGGPCRWDDRCALHDTWVAAAEALRRSLSTSRLAAIADADLALSARL